MEDAICQQRELEGLQIWIQTPRNLNMILPQTVTNEYEVQPLFFPCIGNETTGVGPRIIKCTCNEVVA